MPTLPTAPLPSHAAPWCQAQAEAAFTSLKLRAIPIPRAFEGGWRGSRERVGMMSQGCARSILEALAGQGLFEKPPECWYHEGRSKAPQGAAWDEQPWFDACGVLEIGESLTVAWPARAQIAYHEGYETDAPGWGSGSTPKHLLLRTASLLAGSLAERMAAKAIAKAAVGSWIEQACADVDCPHGQSMRSAFEREALGCEAAPAQARARRRAL